MYYHIIYFIIYFFLLLFLLLFVVVLLFVVLCGGYDDPVGYSMVMYCPRSNVSDRSQPLSTYRYITHVHVSPRRGITKR